MKKRPNVVMQSMFMNDVDRNLIDRMLHLTEKSYPKLRWIWLVGDSQDETEDILRAYAAETDLDIEVIRVDTDILDETPAIRLRRMSLTRNAGLERARPEDDYWLMHESDLLSPTDIVEQFLATGKCPVAGWVTLGISCFYDTWAYRKDGQLFKNWDIDHRPYGHDIFEVDSVGSCWLIDAGDVRNGLRCESMDVLELSNKLRERGRRIWVDPNIPIVHPEELFICRSHA